MPKPLAALVLLVLLALATSATAQGPSPTSATNCEVLYAELDALMEADGAYSLRLVHRASDYRAIVASLEELRPVTVPYAGEDLDDQPLERPTGLRSTTRTVTRTEPAPNYVTGIGGLTLGGLLLYSGAQMLQSEDTYSASDEEGGSGAVGVMTLGGLLVAGGVIALGNTRTVRDQVPDEDAIRYNRQLRERVEAANERIRAENAERQRKREERSDALATNEDIEAERTFLEERRDEYEQASREQYQATVARLADTGSRRCVDALEETGALVKLENRFAEVYIVTRPLNRDGRLLPNATTNGSLGFSVQTLRLRDPLGTLGSLEAPRSVELLASSRLPADFGGEVDGYLARVPLALDADPIDPDAMTAEGELVAEQDGQRFSTSFARDVILIER